MVVNQWNHVKQLLLMEDKYRDFTEAVTCYESRCNTFAVDRMVPCVLYLNNRLMGKFLPISIIEKEINTKVFGL